MGLYICYLFDYYWNRLWEDTPLNWVNYYDEDGELVGRYIEWEVSTDTSKFCNRINQVEIPLPV